MVHLSARRRLPDHAASATFAAWGSLAGRANHLPVRASAPTLFTLPGVSSVGPKSRPDASSPSNPPVGAGFLGIRAAEETTVVGGRPLAGGGPKLTAATGETPSPVAAVPHQAGAR
jgi:hypothetical protein